MLQTYNLEKLLQDLKNNKYDNIDSYLPEAFHELSELKSADFWSNWVYPKGAKPEDIQNELSDYRMIIENVSEVYERLTNGRISKPNTMPQEVISVVNEIFENYIRNSILEDMEDD